MSSHSSHSAVQPPSGETTEHIGEVTAVGILVILALFIVLILAGLVDAIVREFRTREEDPETEPESEETDILTPTSESESP